MLELQDRIYLYQRKYRIPYTNDVQFPSEKELKFFQELLKKLQLATFDIENFLRKTRK